MQAIATLTIEHRVVERVLAALEGLVEKVTGSGVDGREDLGKLMGVLRSFVEEVHQPKEVGILLAHLLETGLPAARGPMAAMLGDHASARRAIVRLEVLANRPEAWNTRAIELLEQHAADLAVLLRGHMSQEEALLFALADRTFTPETADRVESMFDEHASRTDARALELTAQAAVLVERWAPADEWPSAERQRPHGRREVASQQSLLLG
ncbi:MAG TPA: hemerythrin domain-containing protein [Myxococcales bacterium]|jgi:hemerythrin-like domain-containing protein